MARRALVTYREKLEQTNREAKATVVALAVIVAVWLVGGFGLAGTDLQVLGTPVWIVAGCVGTWVAAIVAAVVLAKFVFADFDLDDDGPAEACEAVEAPEAAETAEVAEDAAEGEAVHG